MWLDMRISLGHLLTALPLLVALIWGGAIMSSKITANTKSIIAINANQTRQGRAETTKVLAAIAELSEKLAVLKAVVGEVRRDIPTRGKR